MRNKMKEAIFKVTDEADGTEDMVKVLTPKEQTANAMSKSNIPTIKKKTRKINPFSRRVKQATEIIDDLELGKDVLPEITPLPPPPPAPAPAEITPINNIVNDLLHEVIDELKGEILKSPAFKKRLKDALEDTLIKDYEKYLKEKFFK